ncbi:hypothetical protein ABK040_009944 [Willaertia magna]
MSSSYYHKLTPEQQTHIKQAFNKIDLNNNGYIEKHELNLVFDLLTKSSPEFSNCSLDELFNLIDTNKDGLISFNEFSEPFAKIFLGQ